MQYSTGSQMILDWQRYRRESVPVIKHLCGDESLVITSIVDTDVDIRLDIYIAYINISVDVTLS